jgi:hypothetical protein
MRGIPRDRPEELGTQEFLSQEQFLQRARTQHSGRDRAANQETFLRNEWGTRTFGFSSLVVDPPNGRTPELNDTGRARASASAGRGSFQATRFDSFDDFSLYDRCVALGINRGMGAAIYGNGVRIFQSPSAVTITYEMIHETRVIPLDGRAHLDADIAQYTGNARGRWEGDTLVIETKNFTDKILYRGAAENLQLVERIKRVGPDELEYRVTITDPTTFTRPWTLAIPYVNTGEDMFEYACHEGNYGMEGILSGAREEERKAAEAKKGSPQ